ncbi:hypothetical protein BASA81_004451 [Batrachochytrium salamandrivorans]|nr:hypothetical protein BASA81_004451 [Batrachochytrium salamandrivorans]
MGEVVVDCVCGKALRLSQIEEHLRVDHILPSKLEDSALQRKMCKGVLEPCPICGKLMQKSSIQRHLGNMHLDGSYHTSKSVLAPMLLDKSQARGGEEEARGRNKRSKRASNLLADVTASESHSEGEEEEEEGGDADLASRSPSQQTLASQLTTEREREMERKRRHKRDKERERRSHKKRIALALAAPHSSQPVPETEIAIAPQKELPMAIFNQDFTIFPCHSYVRAKGTCTTTPLLVKLTKPKRLRPESAAFSAPPSTKILDLLLQPCEIVLTTRVAIAHALDQVSLWPEATPVLLDPIRARAKYSFYREVNHLFADLALALPVQLKPRLDQLREGI